MQWFQVTCPNCTSALQVKLPEGVTSVQCSQCKAVFAVQVQPVALTPPGSVPAVKRSRKRKKDGHEGEYGASSSKDQPRALSAYNVFMKGEVANVKSEHPELPHREAFKLAAERWQSSPMNPQNGGDRFPLKAAPSAAAAPTRAAITAAGGAAGGAIAANGAMPRAESAYDSGADGGLGAAAIEGGGDEGEDEEGEDEEDAGDDDGAADGGDSGEHAAPFPT